MTQRNSKPKAAPKPKQEEAATEYVGKGPIKTLSGITHRPGTEKLKTH